MAAHSRHGSPTTVDVAYKERDEVPEPTAYELERDKREQALHESVQLALLESGFEEATKLGAVFTGEGTTRSPLLSTPQGPRKRRQKRIPSLGEQPWRRAHNLEKYIVSKPLISSTVMPKTQVHNTLQ
jgi:hypothetical protein